MKIAIIYSEALGTLRRIEYFDNDEQMRDPARQPCAGEAQVYAVEEDIEEMVARNTRIRAMHFAGHDVARIAAEHGVAATLVENIKNGLRPHQEIINSHTGRSPGPHDDRFAIVDEDGNVISAEITDPACEPEGFRPKGHRLVHHPEASPGWKFQENTFIAPRTIDYE